MTDRKHLKSRVRARMAHTGERYAAARAHVVARSPVRAPGINPATNALRRLLDDVGLSIPESLALVVGGGIGIGVFQFHYAREDMSSFFLAGRHRWDDDLAFVALALRRLGLEPVTTETTSPRLADRQLRDALADGGPVVAWVDASELGTRAYPPDWSGGAYHVVVVDSLDDDRGVVVLDDLAATPIEVTTETFARARARIAKFRHRLLRLPRPASSAPSEAMLRTAIRDGLTATIDGFDHPRTRSFGLAALDDWATRLRGDGRDAWTTVFRSGAQLWTGLAAIHQGVDHYGSGGGLVRPLFAAGLRESAARLGDGRLQELGATYRSLGAQWSELARAALPDDVPALRRTRELQDRRAARYSERGADARDETASMWRDSDQVRAAVAAASPIDGDEIRALQGRLADRVDALRIAEIDALERLRTIR